MAYPFVTIGKILTITPKWQQSYVIHFHYWFISFSLAYEGVLTIAALITAWIAFRALRASKRQNELSTVPHLTIERQGSVGNYRLLLINHNGKLAYEIYADKIRILGESGKFGYISIEIIPSGRNRRIDFLEDQTKQLELKVLFDGKKSDQDFAIFITTAQIEYPHGYIIKFKDSQNNRYFTRLNFKRQTGETVILRAPTRLSISWMCILWLERNVYDRIWLRYRWLLLVIAKNKKSN